MFERFTSGARRSVALAQDEARTLYSDHVGTDHLLIAVAAEPHGLGGRILRDLGATPDELRDDARRLCGPGSIDPEALATLGIDLDEVRRRVEESFGPGALDPPSRCGDPSGSLPFAPESKKTLEVALRYAVHFGDDFIGSEHLLLALTRVSEGAAAQLLGERGITPGRIEAAVRDHRHAA
jgi:ATP-dependent Clp protease ATP-binding subunit ClpA